MAETVTGLNAYVVFLGLAALGFLFLLVSLLFGELFESFGFDSDTGDAGVAFFNPRVLSVFITTFGAVGAIATNQGYDVFASSAFGFGSGLVTGGMVYLFVRFLYSQQASSAIASSELVGMDAQVSVSIPAGGIGQVRCLVGESMVDKLAKSSDGGEIPFNALVRIDEVVGEFAVVSPRVPRQPSAGPDELHH